jgi:hypothetical protein
MKRNIYPGLPGAIIISTEKIPGFVVIRWPNKQFMACYKYSRVTVVGENKPTIRLAVENMNKQIKNCLKYLS